MISLAEQLETAKRRQEVATLDAGDQKAAAELKARLIIPAVGVPAAAAAFEKWANARGARRCPAKPATIALFVLTQSELGVPEGQILLELDAIERLHDRHSLPNPVRTVAVRTALETVIEIDVPRSWSKDDKAAFAMLPVDIKRAISLRERQRDTALRRAQNEAAKLRQTNGAAKPVHQTEGIASHG